MTYKCKDCGQTKEEGSAEHTWQTYMSSNCQKINDTYHTRSFECKYCDAVKIDGQAEHEYSSYGNSYVVVDDLYHVKARKCYYCDAKIVDSTYTSSHDYYYSWKSEITYEKSSPTHHNKYSTCGDCGYTKAEYLGHEWREQDSTYANGTHHNTTYKCSNCDETKVEYNGHTGTSDEETNRLNTAMVNGQTHRTYKTCNDCHQNYYVDESHYFEEEDVVVARAATPTQAGVRNVYCHMCRCLYYSEAIPYTTDGDDSNALTIVSHTDVYRTTTNITVRLSQPCKGGILKLRVGKKVYNKKLGASKLVKFKIKKPGGYGMRYSYGVYYKGRLVSDDDCYLDYDEHVVWYGKKVKNGMTKKQVQYTWGEPYSTSTSAGGWTYWYYSDGSYIYFKNGKVKYWYNAK